MSAKNDDDVVVADKIITTTADKTAPKPKRKRRSSRTVGKKKAAPKRRTKKRARKVAPQQIRAASKSFGISGTGDAVVDAMGKSALDGLLPDRPLAERALAVEVDGYLMAGPTGDELLSTLASMTPSVKSSGGRGQALAVDLSGLPERQFVEAVLATPERDADASGGREGPGALPRRDSAQRTMGWPSWRRLRWWCP